MENLLNQLEQYLDTKRYQHSLRVAETAVDLARRYSVDIEKARLAGLIHDCAKSMPYERLLELVQKYSLTLDEICIEEKELIHGPLGARIAKEEFGIIDEEVLSAIESHTTGKRGMSILDKIIYLADFIEPGRDYPGVEHLREMALRDLDRALLQAFDNTIKYVLSLGAPLHPRTVDARNDILRHLAQ